MIHCHQIWQCLAGESSASRLLLFLRRCHLGRHRCRRRLDRYDLVVDAAIHYKMPSGGEILHFSFFCFFFSLLLRLLLLGLGFAELSATQRLMTRRHVVLSLFTYQLSIH